MWRAAAKRARTGTIGPTGMKILVTGAAGFIGSRVMYDLVARGDEAVGIDNYNDYYDVRLKEARVAEFGLEVRRIDISDKAALDSLFADEKFDKVVNMAAQAGVRHSIVDPAAYLQNNIAGFLNLLEACRNHGVKHLVFASSSSVYGLNGKVPFSEGDRTDSPASLYAATKKADELLAYSYCSLYGISMTGLRYFTVYGPWGRPDMSPMLFAHAICNGEPIRVFNGGDMTRDFTYIDDIAEGTIACIEREPAPDENGLRYRIYNIGCGHPVRLTDFISELEHAMGAQARKEMLPMQPGDICRTAADTSLLERETGYKPRVRLGEGLAKFAEWYKNYHN